MAPSRPHPLCLYRARSHSEPNIPELLNNATAAEQAEHEPELSFLDEGDTSPLHASSSHLDQVNKRLNIPFHLQPSNLSRFPPHAIDKNENIRNFLASLPNISVEDDPGLGDNVCTSESGSGFSSPVSSPTDEDHLPSRYNKLAKEIRREHKSTSEQQKELKEEGGEEERTGEEEEGERGEEGEHKELRDINQGGQDLERRAEEEGGKERKMGEEEEENDGTTRIKISKEEEEEEDCGIVLSGTISSLPEATHDEGGVSTVLAERSQPVAGSPVSQGIPKLLKFNSLPWNIVSQQDPYFQEYVRPPFPSTSEIEYESMLAEQGSTVISEIRSESVYEPSLSPSDQSNRELSSQQNMSGPVELPQIYSVPERIKEIEEMNSVKGSSKSLTIPPSDGLSSEKKYVGEDFGVGDKDTEMISLKGSSKSPTVSPSDGLSSEKRYVGGEDLDKDAEMTLLKSSSLSPTVPGLKKDVGGEDFAVGDSKDTEMTSLKGSSKSPTVLPSDDLSSEKKDDVGGEEFGVGDNKDSASMTRTPSSHSVSSSLSGGDEELNQLNSMSDNNSSKSVHLVTTRHSSISPYLPPAMGANTHVRTASCSHLPSQHTGSPDPSPLTFDISTGDGVCLVQPGAGAVKARVMNIEERNRDRDERSVSSDDVHVSVRRQSLQFNPSTSSEVVLPEPSFSNPEVRDVKYLISTQRRPSSDIIHEHHSPNPTHQMRETTPPAFLSAWSKLVDEIPTMPVQDLKKKFEDSDAASVSSSVGSSASITNRPLLQVRHKTRSSNLRRSQSLRNVESPGKSKYKVKGSKGIQKKLDRVGSPCSQD